MPIYLNNGGSTDEYDVFVNQGGTAVECEVYVNQGGSPVLVYQPEIIVDDFEGEVLGSQPSNWNIPSQTGTVDISSAAYQSTRSMNHQVDGYTEAWGPAGNFEGVPSPGDTWEFYFRYNTMNAGAQFRFWFARQGVQNDSGYCIEAYEDGTFRLEKKQSGGSLTTVGTGNYTQSYTTGTWYKVEYRWQRTDTAYDHVIDLINTSNGNTLATLQLNDATFTSGGGVGVVVNENGGTLTDLIRITDRE